MITEEWRVIPNVEQNTFLISSLGRLFNIKTHQFVKPYFHKR